MHSPMAYAPLVTSRAQQRSSFTRRCNHITTAMKAIFVMNAKVLPTDVCSTNNTESVLYRKSSTVCLLSWTICILYILIISFQSYAAPQPICNVVPNGYGSFFSFACAAAVSGFFFTFMMLSVRIFQASPGSERVPSIIALNVISVGLLSTLSFVIFNFNGVCIDINGVATPAMMWSEWLSNGPTIVFLTLALTEKKDLSKMDLSIMMSFFVCMVSGFLPIIPQPRFLAYVWIAVSAVTCLPVLYLPWYVSRHERAADIEEGGSNQSTGSKKQKQQFNLALWTTIVCPLFPLNYALAATKVIGPGESAGMFLLLTLLLKAFFAASLADAHTNVLLDARKELEKERLANESRRAFLKYLFHEVRTPLNSLTMGIELLKTRDSLEVADLELLAMMTGAADFMSETLNNILSMQKIEEGKMELTFAPFSIGRSIIKIFSALSGAVMAKNLLVEKNISDEVPPLLVGDVYRVEHVISNLLSNAIKFSPDGAAIRLNVTATATVTTTQDTESLPSTSITVSITDEGPGISAEDQGKLFNGFFQVRPDQLQQGKGSGLGLALCKQIVTLHGGTIGVDSAEGQGSTFHFTIPFGVPTVVISEPQESNKQEEMSKQDDEIEIPPITITLPVANLRASAITVRSNLSLYESAESNTGDSEFAPGVLVVDDVASNRKMLQALLKKNGAKKVDTAENGLEAVQAAQANAQKYDIIFMDNYMPVMCGVEAVRKLREGGYGKLVVGVTGNILDDDVVEYLAAGADMVLGKPVKLDMLRMLIRHVKVNGNLSMPDMTLSEDGGYLAWKKK